MLGCWKANRNQKRSGARGLVRALKESQEGDGYAARLGVCQEELERREGIPCVFWTYITKSQLA